MPHLNAPLARRCARAVALTTVAVVSLAVSLVVSLAAPALADAPETWADPEPVSTLYVLLILVGIPAALFVGISLLVYVPSMARGEKHTSGLGWRNESEWFGGPRGGVEAADATGVHVRAGVGFTSSQRHEIDKAIRDAETVCRYEFSVFVGASEGEDRPFAQRLHSTLTAPDRSVLVMVDPAAGVVEIVTGAEVRRDLDDAEVKLAALTMQTAFAAGDLVGGIKQGVMMLADHARRPRMLHAE